MFSTEELNFLHSLEQEYTVSISNGHDIRIQSRITGHEWVIISPYDVGPCEILHRHSARNPLHHQRGRYLSLKAALEYIRNHDNWFAQRKEGASSIEATKTITDMNYTHPR